MVLADSDFVRAVDGGGLVVGRYCTGVWPVDHARYTAQLLSPAIAYISWLTLTLNQMSCWHVTIVHFNRRDVEKLIPSIHNVYGGPEMNRTRYNENFILE